MLKKKIYTISKEIEDLLEKYTKRGIPEDVYELLYAKKEIFREFSSLMESGEINSEKLQHVKIIFNKWKLNEYIAIIDTINNLYLTFQKDKSLIPLLDYLFSENFSDNLLYQGNQGIDRLLIINKVIKDIKTMKNSLFLLNGDLTKKVINGFAKEPLFERYKSLEKEELVLKPFDIALITKACEELKKKTPCYQGKELNASDFMDFIRQFPDGLKIFAIKLLKKIVYISFEEMRENLLSLINQITINFENLHFVLFDSEDAIRKSGDSWFYFLKNFSGNRFNWISPKNLLKILENLDDSIDHFFVFIDDVIGTGNQFITLIESELKNVLTKVIQIKRQKSNIHFHLLAGIGSYNSRKIISEKVQLFNLEDIRYFYNLGEQDKAFFLEKWMDKEKLDTLMEFLKKKDSKKWHGYKNSQFLVVLEWNTPNNTIGCLWNNPDGWKPLFPRI
ncbi:MAG: hypothetical protein ACFFBP_22660 [Promethearchaeota archaeon]